MNTNTNVWQRLSLIWWIKAGVVAIAVLFAILYSIPTFLGDPAQWPHKMVSHPTEGQVKEYTHWYHRFADSFLPNKRVSLGLDLRGGLHLTMEVDAEGSAKESVRRVMNRALADFESKNWGVESFDLDNQLNLTLNMKSLEHKDKVMNEVLDRTTLLAFNGAEGNTIKFNANEQKREEFLVKVLEQSIKTIRDRIDRFGVAEPSIYKQGDNRIIVQLPGLQDVERAKSLIGSTALLEFRLVLPHQTEQLYTLLDKAREALDIPEDDISVASVKKMSNWLIEQGDLDKDSELVYQRTYITEKGKTTLNKEPFQTFPLLVEANTSITGDDLTSASAIADSSTGLTQYVVSFEFNPRGAKLFGELTKEASQQQNEKRIAILLDNNVKSAPNVENPILGGQGQITLGTSNIEIQQREANDLALVLKAGSIPAKLSIVEERQIGPSEGADNIRAGVLSAILAAVLVFLLMLLIYGRTGITANLAMLINALLILSILSTFGATLTLPGIAGIVLTMAVAVDGNIIILERIKEELRNGLSYRQAFYKSYNISYTTLVDANLTTAAAGFVLFAMGNPTIRGFALTLLTGIACTLFTSYLVTQVIGQFLVERKESSKREVKL